MADQAATARDRAEAENEYRTSYADNYLAENKDSFAWWTILAIPEFRKAMGIQDDKCYGIESRLSYRDRDFVYFVMVASAKLAIIMGGELRWFSGQEHKHSYMLEHIRSHIHDEIENTKRGRILHMRPGTTKPDEWISSEDGKGVVTEKGATPDPHALPSEPGVDDAVRKYYASRLQAEDKYDIPPYAPEAQDPNYANGTFYDGDRDGFYVKLTMPNGNLEKMSVPRPSQFGGLYPVGWEYERSAQMAAWNRGFKEKPSISSKDRYKGSFLALPKTSTFDGTKGKVITTPADDEWQSRWFDATVSWFRKSNLRLQTWVASCWFWNPPH